MSDRACAYSSGKGIAGYQGQYIECALGAYSGDGDEQLEEVALFLGSESVQILRVFADGHMRPERYFSADFKDMNGIIGDEYFIADAINIDDRVSVAKLGYGTANSSYHGESVAYLEIRLIRSIRNSLHYFLAVLT